MPVQADYRNYREDLKQDFNSRCGYTDCSDRWWGVKFQVDHFAPQNPPISDPAKKQRFEDLSCAYTNLVYVCPQVNNAKRNLWISDNPGEPVVNNEGLMDPCGMDYNLHFQRTDEGRIIPKDHDPIAAYMIDKLKLYLFRYELYWRIDEIYECAKRLSGLKNNQTVMSKYSQEVNELLGDLFGEFMKYFEYIGIHHNELV